MPGATTSGLTSEEVASMISQLITKVGPGCGALTDNEMLVVGNQMLVYYNHWENLDLAVRKDLDKLYHLWEVQLGPEYSEQLQSLAETIIWKQFSLPRELVPPEE